MKTFHLITMKSTFEYPNGGTKEYIYRSHGGRIFLMALFVGIALFYAKIIPVAGFTGILAGGILLMIAWDLHTATMFKLKMERLQKQKMQLQSQKD